MKRSTFIYLSVMGTAAVALPSLHCNNKKGLNKVLYQPLFLSHICDAKTLREIGKRYKDQLPSQLKEYQLAGMLLTDSTGKPMSQTSDNSVITSLLNKKVQDDFETGRTVVVNGWILSETEAQQCVLFSLS